MTKIKTALDTQVKFGEWLKYRLRRSLPALILIVLFMFLSFSMIIDMSGTTDEKYHLTRGVMFLNTGDPRLNQHHPILFNTFYAIPTLFDEDLVLPDTADPLWINVQKDSLSDHFVELNGGKVSFAQNVLFGPRVLAITTSAFFLYLIFRLVEKFYGYKRALIMLGVFALSPTVIAHSSLVTTDAPAMYTIFISTILASKFVERIKDPLEIKYYILVSIPLTIALLTKYTALFSSGLILILFFLKVCLDNKQNWKKRLRDSTIRVISIIIPITFLMFIAYSFEVGSMFDMTYGNEAKVFANLDGFRVIYQLLPYLERPLKFFFYNVPLPFPQYINGFYENVFKHNIFGHDSFLLGEFSKHGWIYYFPVTFILKEYLGTVILTCVVVSFTVYSSFKKLILMMPKLHITPDILMTAVPLLLLLLSVSSSLNLGIRHILPVYPFLFLGLSTFIVKYLHARIVKILLMVFFMGNVFALAIRFPYYLEFYNILVGEQGEGYKYVRDSNFDWEQNEIRIERYIAENSEKKISTDPSDLATVDMIIISKEELYPKPSKITPEILQLQNIFEQEDNSVKIGVTHLGILTENLR